MCKERDNAQATCEGADTMTAGSPHRSECYADQNATMSCDGSS